MVILSTLNIVFHYYYSYSLVAFKMCDQYKSSGCLCRFPALYLPASWDSSLVPPPEAHLGVWSLTHLWSCSRRSWRNSEVMEGWRDITCNTNSVAMPRRKDSFWKESSSGVFFQVWEISWVDNKGYLLVRCVTYVHNTADKNAQNEHKHRETQTRGENEISNSSKSHRWTYWQKTCKDVHQCSPWKTLEWMNDWGEVCGHVL